MASPPAVIRFFCACGQRVSAPATHAGKSGGCPKCRAKVVIPAQSAPKADPPAPPEATTSPLDADTVKHIMAELKERCSHSYATKEGYYVQIKFAGGRSQGVVLSTVTDAAGQPRLEVTSSIGMMAMDSEASKAMRHAAEFPEGRLYVDKTNMIKASLSLPLVKDKPKALSKAVELLAWRADEIEKALFGMDLR